MDSRVALVIAAAGSGSRIPGDVPKQWRMLGKRPVLAHVFDFFDALPQVRQMAFALDPATLENPRRMAYLTSRHGKTVRFTQGGGTRQESVWNALQLLEPAPEVVLVQDAARPFPEKEAVVECIHQARTVGGAVLARPVTETIKQVDQDRLVTQTLNRQTLWAAQTPQGFRFADLMAAYQKLEGRLHLYTDDAGIFEAVGGQVAIVESTATNLKITHPEDFERAEKILEQRSEAAS